MGYGITSKSQIIDLDTIKSGCSKLREQATHFQTAAKYVTSAANICNSKVLAIGTTSLDGKLANVAAEIAENGNKLISTADAVQAEAERIYNVQMQEYKDYLRRIAEAEERRRRGER